MSEALILQHETGLVHSMGEAAIKLKENALEQSALIMRVGNPDQNETAVAAQRSVKEIISLVEKSRKAAKEPILEAGRKLDAVCEQFTAELQAEYNRLGKLCGDYQQLIEAKRKAEEAAKVKALLEVERQREAEVAKAKSLEEVTKLRENAAEAARQISETKTATEPVRATSQVVRKVWEIEIVSLAELYAAHPHCVKLEALRGEITLLLDAGIQVKGVNAMKVTRSDVRPGKGQLVNV